MTIREALAAGSADLAAGGIENPGLDASLLLAEILNTSRSSLIASGSQALTEESFAAFNNLLKRRLAGECVAYITGKKEFYGLEFKVNPSVLVPRPETELLVELVLRIGDRSSDHGSASELHDDTSDKNPCYPFPVPRSPSQPFRVLDLCTGSGAIAIALKHEMPELEVWATDISAEALALAAANATRLLPPDSIIFHQGDLYDAFHFSLFTFHFSFIVSNPPYVPTTEIPNLSPEVRREPVLALNGGSDGLDLIRRIISSAPFHLVSGGVLLLEADPRQMTHIGTLLDQAGFIDVQIHKDLSGKERVIGGRKP